MPDVTYEYLDVRDKNNIIINHMRSVEYNLYNVEIQKVLANSATTKDEQLLTQLSQEITDGVAKIAELKGMLTPEG